MYILFECASKCLFKRTSKGCSTHIVPPGITTRSPPVLHEAKLLQSRNGSGTDIDLRPALHPISSPARFLASRRRGSRSRVVLRRDNNSGGHVGRHVLASKDNVRPQFGASARLDARRLGTRFPQRGVQWHPKMHQGSVRISNLQVTLSAKANDVTPEAQ